MQVPGDSASVIRVCTAEVQEARIWANWPNTRYYHSLKCIIYDAFSVLAPPQCEEQLSGVAPREETMQFHLSSMHHRCIAGQFTLSWMASSSVYFMKCAQSESWAKLLLRHAMHSSRLPCSLA